MSSDIYRRRTSAIQRLPALSAALQARRKPAAADDFEFAPCPTCGCHSIPIERLGRHTGPAKPSSGRPSSPRKAGPSAPKPSPPLAKPTAHPTPSPAPPEAESSTRAQRRARGRQRGAAGYWKRMGGGSLAIAVGLHLALLAIGAFLIIRTIRQPEKKIDFLPSGRGGGGSESVSVKPARNKARANPSTGLKRVMAEGATTSFALPPPGDSFDSLPQLDSLGGGGLGRGLGGKSGFGQGTGAGPGIGSGLTGGFGGSGGAVTFFRQEIKARRVAYVIDYSASMRGKREKLMRQELAKSVGQLSPLMQFQLIFFSGPVWLAGDEVTMAENRRTATIRRDGDQFDWEQSSETPGAWEPKGRRPPRATWLDARKEALEKAGRQIAETPLVYGTYWIAPLEMALAMDPAPDLIFFMTDGVSASGKDPQVIKALSHRAKTRKTVINTIAMMEPQAEESMKLLAHGTGGQFSIIDKDGTVRVVPPG